MNVLHEHTLVLKDVTLGLLVEGVVPAKEDSMVNQTHMKITHLNAQVLVNLASLSVLPQQPPQNSLSTHPEHFRRHPGLARTLPLTGASVSSLSLCGQKSLRSGARVHRCGFDNHTTILDEFLDVRAGVGIADFSLLSGVKPDFAFANAGDARGEALLRP